MTGRSLEEKEKGNGKRKIYKKGEEERGKQRQAVITKITGEKED